MAEARTVCHTPTPGAQPTSIPSWKYQLIRTALLQVVPTAEPGIAAKELPQLVRSRLDPESLAKLGSVSWHTTTVRLNMEVDGELQRVAGRKPLHLYQPASKSPRSGKARD